MKVVLVGAGPGDPGLLTIKGRDALASADTVVYDALANPALLSYARPGAEMIYVGKVADRHALPQAEINALLVQKAREGKFVARLKGGDPYIFGRGGEEAEYLVHENIPFEEIPGITSAIAAPAYAGIPLTHRDLASSLTIITGHENPDKGASSHNWPALAAAGSTLVFVMGMKNLGGIVGNLLAAGMDPQMPAAIIYRGATPAQRVLTAPLANLPQKAVAEHFTNPAIIVVGRVAALRPKLDWFSKLPLLGKTIVVTRAREQASGLARALAELGARVLECPSILVEPLSDYSLADRAIERLAGYDWVIFTSANGVKYFWQRLEIAGLDSRVIPKVEAIGPATAQALKARGINADLIPPDYVAEAAATALIEKEGEKLENMKILLPRAAKARSALPDALARAGAAVDVVPAYQTRPGGEKCAEVRKLLAEGGLDCITFGSSSTVDNFLKIISAEELLEHPEIALAPIGPITAGTLRKHGLEPKILPEKFDIPGLLRAVSRYYAPNAGGNQCL